jgi:hypothetical protein
MVLAEQANSCYNKAGTACSSGFDDTFAAVGKL